MELTKDREAEIVKAVKDSHDLIQANLDREMDQINTEGMSQEEKSLIVARKIMEGLKAVLEMNGIHVGEIQRPEPSDKSTVM